MPKGFVTLTRPNTRYVAVELNLEQDGDVIDLIELHHLEIRKPASKKDLMAIAVFTDAICEGANTISPVEFLAEMYVCNLCKYATAIGANVARLYHNSCLGDNRIRANAIGHIYDSNDDDLPALVLALIKKYVALAHKVTGDKVTLRNRLGV